MSEKPWEDEPTCWNAFAEHCNKTESILRKQYHNYATIFNRYVDFRAGFMAGGCS